jgi:hypothetical protein
MGVSADDPIRYGIFMELACFLFNNDVYGGDGRPCKRKQANSIKIQ